MKICSKVVGSKIEFASEQNNRTTIKTDYEKISLQNSLKECLIVFTNYFTAWPLANPMAIEGVNFIVAGGVQRLLIHWRCAIYLGSPAWSYRIQNACDSSANERRIRKSKTYKQGEIGVKKRARSRPREAWDYCFYHSIRNWTSARWNSGGIPGYPTALISMMINYHLAANLLEI